MMKLINKIRKLFDETAQLKKQNEELRLLIGAIAAQQTKNAVSIAEAEFKVFSQYGDDGIIQFLIRKIKPVNNFVEFGVETYIEANTRFLLMHDNWSGLIIDGSEKNINIIKDDAIYWQYDLTAINSFITAENINQLLIDNGFTDRIGLLSIDIDGNDYWIWQAITAVTADIIIIEYNSLFGDSRAITVPYKSDFFRTNEHYSNLYFGASLAALVLLGEQKGYFFIGCNSGGNNAYFLNNRFADIIQKVDVKSGYIKAKFRESRSKTGELTYLNDNEKQLLIRGLPVYNIITDQIEVI